MSKYKCETCNKECTQLYGDNINGKYTERCVKCAFKINDKKK